MTDLPTIQYILIFPSSYIIPRFHTNTNPSQTSCWDGDISGVHSLSSKMYKDSGCSLLGKCPSSAKIRIHCHSVKIRILGDIGGVHSLSSKMYKDSGCSLLGKFPSNGRRIRLSRSFWQLMTKGTSDCSKSRQSQSWKQCADCLRILLLLLL
mgnify:CR=1 FL=1